MKTKARLLLGVIAFSTGCAGASTVSRCERIVVRVQDDGAAAVAGIAGAEVRLDGHRASKTGADGLAPVELRGRPGDTFSVGVVCPADYRSPKTFAVSFVELTDRSIVPEFNVRCVPLHRNVTVAVRAENGPNLPVMFLGREVGRTDATGAARVVLRIRPHDPTVVSLLTTDDARALVPQNPSTTLIAADRDDVFPFDIRLTPTTPEKRILARRARRSAPAAGPLPL